MLKKPQKIKVIYNDPYCGGRFIIVLRGSHTSGYQNKQLYDCLTMSDNPDHPQGISQFSDCAVGCHLGKRIQWTDLTNDIQQHIIHRLK